MVRTVAICLAVSVLVAGVAYVVGKALPSTYQSYGVIRIVLASQGGISDPVVTAANDTATQYAQLAASAPVTALAARTLQIPASTLRGKITGSTLGAQNLVQVIATAPSSSSAMRRAAAASAALQRYLTNLNAQESAQYVARVQNSLAQVTAEVRALSARLAQDSPTQRATDAILLESLNNQHDQLLGQVARDAASNQPTLQVVDSATPATVLVPVPKLYALVAFIVALIITGRAAFVLTMRRRG
jgi:hypothetical protein